MKQKVYNLIILDESGSMEMIAKQAVSGLNETLQSIVSAQKEHEDQEHYVSFVTFNSSRINTVMNRQKVELEKDLKWNDFSPNNCTPLFDAMGQSICELRNNIEKDDVVLVTIITDGMENASREYDGKSIKKLVSDLKERGWLFVYIGTNQDVDAVADSMGIRSRMCYDYSPAGAECMFEVERSSKRAFFDRLSRKGRSILLDEEYDYFSPNDQEDKKDEKEPDIIWDMKEEESSSSYDKDPHDKNEKESAEAEQKQDNSATVDIEGSKKHMGLWDKVKNFIK